MSIDDTASNKSGSIQFWKKPASDTIDFLKSLGGAIKDDLAAQKVEVIVENDLVKTVKVRENSELLFNVKQPDDIIRCFDTEHKQTVPTPHIVKSKLEETEGVLVDNSILHEDSVFVSSINPNRPFSPNTASSQGFRFDSPPTSFGDVSQISITGTSWKNDSTPLPVRTFDEPIKDSVSQKVRMQYEQLPYPMRDPEKDKTDLIMTMVDNLMIVNQRCFQGKMNFNNEFQVLVAGGGTGDASTYLAVQMGWLPNARVVYVDLSTESIRIAKERLHNQAVRLGNPNIERIVEFYHGSLLDVGKMNLGPFDYINCSGVLHHLTDPTEGLMALKSVLKPRGAMGIMVYGQIGRTTIYQIQELMRIVNRNVEDTDEKIRNTNLLLKNLPGSNLHHRGGRWLENEPNPVEIYDLFLHCQDRAYTIDQLYDWVEGGGLHLETFFAGLMPYILPEFYGASLPQNIRNRLKRMSVREQQAFAELLFGHINKFEFYVTERPDCGVDLNNPDLIPSYSIIALNQNLPERLKNVNESDSTFFVANHLDKMLMSVSTTPLVKYVYRQIDGVNTTKEILYKTYKEFSQVDMKTLTQEVGKSLKKLYVFDMLNFRHKESRCEKLNSRHY